MIGPYWEQLSQRERALIGIAAAALVLLLLMVAVIRPALGYRADAKDAYARAVETYTLVHRAAAVPAGTTTLSTGELRLRLDESARELGIVISRINLGEDVVDLSTGVVSPDKLFGWLALLEQSHGVVVAEAAVRPAPNGAGVTARLTMVAR